MANVEREVERALAPAARAYDRYVAAEKGRTERLWEEATGRCWRCRKKKRPWQGVHRCKWKDLRPEIQKAEFDRAFPRGRTIKR